MPTLIVFAISLLVSNYPQAPQPPHRRQYWSGSLIDADCRAEHPTRRCLIGKNTKNFGVLTSDAKFFKFDPTGNNTAPALLQKAQNRTREVPVGVFGRAQEGIIQVDLLQIP